MTYVEQLEAALSATEHELARVVAHHSESFGADRVLGVARNIVNGLYELAELSVSRRQLLNDDADEFVVRCLEGLR